MFDDPAVLTHELAKLIRKQEAVLQKGSELTVLEKHEFRIRARRINDLLRGLRDDQRRELRTYLN